VLPFGFDAAHAKMQLQIGRIAAVMAVLPNRGSA